MNSNRDVGIGILWSLAFLPERQIGKIVMQDEELLSIIIRIYTEFKDIHLRQPALRFLGNIGADDDILAKKLLKEYNLIDSLKETIKDSNSFMRKETCWVVSNILCGPVSNCFAVLSSGVLDDILHIYLNDQPKIMHEASWVLVNMTQKLNEK